MSMIQYDDLLRSILIIFLWYSHDIIIIFNIYLYIFFFPDVYTVTMSAGAAWAGGCRCTLGSVVGASHFPAVRAGWIPSQFWSIHQEDIRTSQVFEHVFFDFAIICGILWLLRCFPSGCWLPCFCLVPVAWYFNIVESIESLFAKAKGLSEDWVVKSGGVWAWIVGENAVERSWMWQMLYDVVLCRKRTLRLRPCNVCNVVVQSRHMQIIFHRQSDKQVRNVLYASRVQRWVMVSSC